MYGGGSAGSAGYGVGLGPGPSHYAPPSATVGYQLGPPPPPPPACPVTAGSQLLSYGPDLSPHHIQQTHTETQSKRRRSDEDDPSGCKYRRLDDDNVQDKERFASTPCTYAFFKYEKVHTYLHNTGQCEEPIAEWEALEAAPAWEHKVLILALECASFKSVYNERDTVL
ncbi:hypothetical protein ALC53_04078 [Atta colombica]|uniref:Uncharacterized protein n=1 Tax=Atta colombica TaxID=520822 RepID=A0A195BN77_9HYME|nr:hypothetical protein ALC53_04078 [Atta colombica]